MLKLEMRGVRRSEIMDYFDSLNVKNLKNRKFIGPNWQVEVDEENFVTLGSLKIPSTIVIFRGKQENLEPVISTFRLKFLKAGG